MATKAKPKSTPLTPGLQPYKEKKGEEAMSDERRANVTESLQTRKLEPADAGLALAIVGEVLRWQGRLDGLIDSVMQHPLADDAKVRMVLRMALAQKLRLGTPMHAIIATSLPLLDGGPKRLAHGVLSPLDKSGAVLPATPALPEAMM